MNLTKWRAKRQESGGELERATPFEQFRGEIDRLFDRFMSAPFDWASDLRSWPALQSPAMDVSETDNEIVVRAELPGVDPKEMEITVAGDILTVAGEKKSSSEQKGENYYHVERRFGSFRRSMQLPSGVDRDSVAASFNNGVLTVRMKKTEAAKRKKVKVVSSEGE